MLCRAELCGADAAALVDSAQSAVARVHGGVPAVLAGARELRRARRVRRPPAKPHPRHRHALLPRHSRTLYAYACACAVKHYCTHSPLQSPSPVLCLCLCLQCFLRLFHFSPVFLSPIFYSASVYRGHSLTALLWFQFQTEDRVVFRDSVHRRQSLRPCAISRAMHFI